LRGDTRRGQTSSDVITQGPRAASEVGALRDRMHWD